MDITINNVTQSVKTKSKNIIFTNNNLYYNSGDKVNDEKRGFLYYDNKTSKWVFCGLNQLIPTPNSCEHLILLLESPHKDEYDNFGKPLRPANGKTGLKINKFLTNQIQKSWKLNSNIIYCVWIVNAIQYQMSGYNQLKTFLNYDKIWHTVRNCVFKTVWNSEKLFGLQFDLKTRISSINPAIIINCVTGGKKTSSLRNLVGSVVQCHSTCSHPSMWK